MKSLSPANTNYLLEVSLANLHRESRSWLFEINFWRIELAFYQRLLERVAGRITSVEDKKGVDHFQNLILYFKGELLDQFEHDIREHERYLESLLQNRAPFNEQLYRGVHKKYEDQIQAFNYDFKQYRKDLYKFTERYL
ncbi:hypothetical protein [Pontibacter russatus]|uniref:hypothetical protein n=1 Tax=Pontibacter russatus TaxID=2694929 RepID=UPI00137B9099|nr:hypothetical protein [Pontibacter russatus]